MKGLRTSRIGAGGVLLAVAGCVLQPTPPPREPTIVGVVERLEWIASVDNRTSDVHLTDGQVVRINFNASRELRGSGAHPGDLLVYGDTPTPWHATFEPWPHGDGFEVRTQPDDASDGWITFDFGVRLPLADEYREAGTGQGGDGAPIVYLVNDQGEVMARLY